jgi:hypothetical protein
MSTHRDFFFGSGNPILYFQRENNSDLPLKLLAVVFMSSNSVSKSCSEFILK